MGGTASSGLLICLLRMATKAGGGTGQDSLRRTTALYFACSAAITLAGVLAYWLVMPKLSCLNVKRRKLHQPGACCQWPPGEAHCSPHSITDPVACSPGPVCHVG